MPTKSLHQTILFKGATPRQVYDLLMDSKKHAAFSGAAASISTEEDGRISAYDGYITGKNLALIPGKKVLQEWRASDWHDDQTSTVTFLFSKTPSGTKLTFTHTGIPADDFANIKQGWVDYYWQPMTKYLRREGSG